MNVDFRKLLSLLTRQLLREIAELKAFFNAFAMLFQRDKNINDNYFKEINYSLCITPQVCCLTKLLNDKCDAELRRIYITEPEAIPPFYFVSNNDNGMYYFDDGECFANKTNYIYDFIVNVPTDVTASDVYISALLNKYKLPSKTYQITRI